MANELTDRMPAGYEGSLDGYHVIFGVLFAVFLALALCAAVLAWNWRAWLPGAEGTQSLLGGVRSAVYTVISHLT